MGAQSTPGSTLQGHVAGPMAGDGITVYDATGVQRVVIGNLGGSPPDYGLRITSSDGSTVIIDGTSDVWKVVSSGTVQTAGFGPAAGSAVATVNLSLGVTTASAYLYHAQRSSGVGSYSDYTLSWAPGNGLVSESFEMDLSVSGSTTTLTALTSSSGGTEAARTYRYWVMAEVAF